MTMPIKDITDTLSTISTYYKSHVGVDLEMEMSIDNNDVMAIDYAIKGLEELQGHREAWDGMKEGLLEMSRLHEYVSIKHMIQLIDGIRPKEGDAECPEKKQSRN